ncbi:MAG: hypothetical protein H7Z17_08705 [Fuerstia sp.]|nr:hypothetical protein [Fuerstiella sp.]
MPIKSYFELLNKWVRSRIQSRYGKQWRYRLTAAVAKVRGRCPSAETCTPHHRWTNSRSTDL